MTEELNNSSSSLLTHYIEQMSDVQRIIHESHQALQKLRPDAKMDGLNVDALNLLIQVRGRNLPDGGTKILNDLVSYAMAIDVDFEHIGNKHDCPDQADSKTLPELPNETSLASDTQFVSRISLPIQLTLGALLSALMLLYLR